MTPSCSEWQVLGERPGDCWGLNPSGFSTYLFGKRVFKDVGLLLNLGLIKDRDGQRLFASMPWQDNVYITGL